MTAIVRDDVDEKDAACSSSPPAWPPRPPAVGVAVPFAASWLPSARALAAGAPVDADISRIEPGQQITVEWRGKPVWVLKRTPEMLDQLPKHDALLVDPESQRFRPARRTSRARPAPSSRKSSSPWACARTWAARPRSRRRSAPPPTWAPSGPAATTAPATTRGSTLPRRVFKGSPAPKNLVIPPHRYASDAVDRDRRRHEGGVRWPS